MRGLEDGVITRDFRFAKANKGATVSDKIGKYDDKKGDGGWKKNKKEEMFDDAASWISLASTRAPSVVKLGPVGSTPRPSTGRTSTRYRNIERPSTAGSLRSSFSGRSLASVMMDSGLPSARSQSSHTSHTSHTSLLSHASQVSRTTESTERRRRKRTSSAKTSARKDDPPRPQSATSSKRSERRSNSSSRLGHPPRPQSATSSLMKRYIC